MCNKSKSTTMKGANEKPLNKSKYLYYKISICLYFLGAPNYWYKDFEIPKFVKITHDILSRLCDILIIVFFASLLGSYFTQNNLNEKQKADRDIFAWCFPVYYLVIPNLTRHQGKVREVAYNLAVKTKETYNDTEVEKQIIKQAKLCYTVLGIFVFSMLILYGINGIIQVITKGSAFVTLITVWPDLEDTSLEAGIVRLATYVMWWVYTIRVQAVAYVVVVLITIGLSHQYKNLCSYFCSLENIFDDETLCHEEKERKYEEAFKNGIEMHSNTLKCTKLTQEICNVVFSVQIMINVSALILLMFQMVHSERTPTNAMSTSVTAIAVLISTGCLWWNAGDITVEASFLSTAMFHSGWHHCRKEVSQRIRPMLVISMCQSQVPVELQCLGVVKLSYRSYVTIVRSSYSIFSVLY